MKKPMQMYRIRPEANSGAKAEADEGMIVEKAIIVNKRPRSAI